MLSLKTIFMQRDAHAILFTALLAALFPSMGCEQGPAVAPVTGKVTRDGQPIPGVMVEFQPDKGAPSYAFTKTDGSYEMQYQVARKGALLGHHLVSVRTPSERTDPETGDTVNVSESIPKAYNDETTLEYQVVKGKNNFDIVIQGERAQRNSR
jgi:hypothetical protein